LKNALNKWFKNDLYFHYFDEKNNNLPQKVNFYKKKYFIFKQFKQNTCIHGHFNKERNFGIKHYYPEVKQFITFLRDPLEIYISNYYFVQKKFHFRNGKDYKIEASLEDYLKEVIKTDKSWYLRHFPDGITKDNYKEFLENKFIFIGIMEDYQNSLNKLALLLNKKTISVPTYNKTERDSYELDETLIQEFKNKFELDYKIYEYAKNRLNDFKGDKDEV
jgi:hypothetical protein